ncbi:MAG: SUMO-targeted ubiquitin ligase complex subunit slx8 [Watsoniomyces obsoletus]|nr:MAG: SUMO-targeted ubiquitin ligase complex subunit slx8 [Watsoniomyces obsoletus]
MEATSGPPDTTSESYGIYYPADDDPRVGIVFNDDGTRPLMFYWGGQILPFVSMEHMAAMNATPSLPHQAVDSDPYSDSFFDNYDWNNSEANQLFGGIHNTGLWDDDTLPELNLNGIPSQQLHQQQTSNPSTLPSFFHDPTNTTSIYTPISRLAPPPPGSREASITHPDWTGNFHNSDRNSVIDFNNNHHSSAEEEERSTTASPSSLSDMPQIARKRRRAASPVPGPSERVTKRTKATGKEAKSRVANNEEELGDEVEELGDQDNALSSMVQQQQEEEHKQDNQPTRLSSLQCVICLEPPTDMTVTFCGHLFCHGCLMLAINSAEANRGKCPVCRQPVNIEPKGRGGKGPAPGDYQVLEIKYVTRPRPGGESSASGSGNGKGKGTGHGSGSGSGSGTGPSNVNGKRNAEENEPSVTEKGKKKARTGTGMGTGKTKAK